MDGMQCYRPKAILGLRAQRFRRSQRAKPGCLRRVRYRGILCLRQTPQEGTFMETYYNVFHRTWWRANPAWPNGLEPKAGRKTYLRRRVTEADARAICKQYNETHAPGKLSRKAEYEEA
jgi:hypothetical protein